MGSYNLAFDESGEPVLLEDEEEQPSKELLDSVAVEDADSVAAKPLSPDDD